MRYGTVTDATGPEVTSRAVDVFGPAGHGLQLTGREMLAARFESPVGHVALEASQTDDARTEVTIETREFDREVEAFIRSLPRRNWVSRLLQRRKRER